MEEESEYRLDEGRDVDLEFLTHGQDYLLYQQDDGVLYRASGAPELLEGGREGERGKLVLIYSTCTVPYILNTCACVRTYIDNGEDFFHVVPGMEFDDRDDL